MVFEHVSVLLRETIDNLDIKSNGIYVDGTLGGAGHSKEICKKLSSDGMLIGIDQDINAINASTKRLSGFEAKVEMVNDNFKNILQILKELNIQSIDGVILDLGVSSHQLDEASRGFSYQHDAPLDMRMDRDKNPVTVAELLNRLDEKSIAAIIRDYGEEKWAARIASFIVKKRIDSPIMTTGQLVEIIKAAVPASARRDGPHPAKRTFQALRIAVNEELEILDRAIQDFIDILKPGGRLCVITFHSLEDRIVKNAFARNVKPCICPPSFPVCNCDKEPKVVAITKKPIEAGGIELEQNPRARSAKLRVVEKVIS